MGHSLRVLVIADSEEDADLLRQRLASEGYDSTCRRITSLLDLARALEEPRPWDLGVFYSCPPNLVPLQALRLMEDLGIDLPVIGLTDTANQGDPSAEAALSPPLHRDKRAPLKPLVQRTLRVAEARRRARRVPAGWGDPERLFSVSLELFCIAGFDGYFKRVNPAFERALGFSRIELLSQPAIEFVHPEDRAATMEAIERLATGQHVCGFENRYRRTDGTYRRFTWAVCPAVDEGLMYGAARDITDQSDVAEALAAANQELESFSYSVSHDLRSPLRSIIGFSELLLENHRASLDDEANDYLRRIVRASERMRDLIDDLLSFARVKGKQIGRMNVDASAMAQRAVTILRETEPEREVEVVCRQGVWVQADPTLLSVVFDNLFGNAWKYTRQRREALIEFGFTEEGNERVYFVRDNGAGFDMAHAGRLFEPLVRLHGYNEFEGTGIGLAMVRRIVERHGGRIWTEAEVNRGAVFYFTLGEKRVGGERSGGVDLLLELALLITPDIALMGFEKLPWHFEPLLVA